MAEKPDAEVADSRDSHTWALVLAAGEGSRLSSLTTDTNGITIPKQFCSLHGGPSLLAATLDRARAVVPGERVCAVVAEQHRRWWSAITDELPSANIVVQPQNRGTANGILLPLMRILSRDASARIVVLPSDHYFSDEAAAARSLRAAVDGLSARSRHIVLLGIEPEDADAELGYIVPGDDDGRETLPVRRFTEKPEIAIARRLVAEGALWNSLIFAAAGRGLLRLFERRCPEVVTAMQAALREPAPPLQVPGGLAVLYERLPSIDFSRHILESATECLRVCRVPKCGWTDLGTVRRVADTLDQVSAHTAPAPRQAAHFDLARALRAWIAQHRSGDGEDELHPAWLVGTAEIVPARSERSQGTVPLQSGARR